MKRLSLLASLLAVSLLVGCEMLPARNGANAAPTPSACLGEVPSLEESDCLLESWVDFGLAAQRADDEWRERILQYIQGDTHEARLARAVVYSWDEQDQWERASDLFKADLAAAPSRLQPLLRQWLNALEARRSLAQELSSSETSRRQLIRERDELAEKLDALTEIEESINLRSQEP